MNRIKTEEEERKYEEKKEQEKLRKEELKRSEFLDKEAELQDALTESQNAVSRT